MRGKLRRAGVVGAVILLAGGLAVAATQVAGAQPQPSIDSVRATINTLTGEFNKANQQYDQVEEQLAAANARLKQVDKELARDQGQYAAARKLVAQIAASTYEDSGSTSLAGLLTSDNPSQVLSEASLVLQITGNRNLQTQAFLTAANQLASVQQEQQRTEEGIAQLAAQRKSAKDKISSLLSKQNSILNSLTNAELTAVQQGTVNGGGGITSATYTGPTGSQTDTAVAYVFKQLGCSYDYGATGPCSVGFDCSGLVMEAWAAAGITIPRDTYEQWAALPHVSASDLQPGDLLYYNGIGHVAMYVGGGMIIDAPSAGQPVREIPMSTAWYADSFDGAARPLFPRGDDPPGDPSKHGGVPPPSPPRRAAPGTAPAAPGTYPVVSVAGPLFPPRRSANRGESLSHIPLAGDGAPGTAPAAPSTSPVVGVLGPPSIAPHGGLAKSACSRAAGRSREQRGSFAVRGKKTRATRAEVPRSADVPRNGGAPIRHARQNGRTAHPRGAAAPSPVPTRGCG